MTIFSKGAFNYYISMLGGMGGSPEKQTFPYLNVGEGGQAENALYIFFLNLCNHWRNGSTTWEPEICVIGQHVHIHMQINKYRCLYVK